MTFLSLSHTLLLPATSFPDFSIDKFLSEHRKSSHCILECSIGCIFRCNLLVGNHYLVLLSHDSKLPLSEFFLASVDNFGLIAVAFCS